MNGTRTDISPRTALVAAAAVVAAAALAVFYHGPQLALFAGAQFLLIAWLTLSLLKSDGVRLPVTPISVSLSLYWTWLGITLYWTTVPVTSAINFWWIGTPALVFWCYTLSPDRDRIRYYLVRLLPLGALALCALAMVQLFLWHEPPRATFINIHSFAALLMLIALPLCACFLLLQQQGANRAGVIAVGVCLFVLFFAIALTEGRGTTLSLILGMVVLSTLAWTTARARSIFASIGLLLAAYVAAHLILHEGITGGRLVTLSDPMSAGVPRFLIWCGSWHLLMANPWWGIGLGTYYLAWPPYRDSADATLGYFVHNDYLQIWIEAGLPALLLLLALFGSVLYMLVRFLRRRPAAAVKLEAIGLFSGLLAIAIHSAVDFDFYILPIGIVAGLALGRFQECVSGVLPSREICLRPERLARRWLYGTAVVLLALVPISFFISLGVSDQLFRRGFALAAAGQLQEADGAFTRAENLLSLDDKVLVSHADLYRRVLERVPKSAESERRALYESALAMLDEAESANPYRPLTHAMRARMLQENPDFAGPEWRRQAEAAYAHALALDPRYFLSRVAYAQLLLETGRAMEAYGVLEDGMTYWYYPGPAVLVYYDFAGRLAKQVGQTARAAEIERLSEELRRTIAHTAPVRPLVLDLGSPVASSAD